MKYRADIDGLRAIAVLSVVVFHLGIPGFQGGYVGVDIFFVISGYLITSIIKSKYESQSFKLREFYTRRIRRLVPPLVVTVAGTLLGSALVMMPYDMVAVSRSATAALFSLSNFVFYSESGYWDTASELKPLLHTWSLGVEEQFYLFWPALIVGLLGARRYLTFGTSLALISVLGAALCIWFSHIDQSAAFYLLPFRVFQFAVGAWLITLISTAQKKALAYPTWIPGLIFWSGVLCIAISVVSFKEDTLFPGWVVLLPTAGAALVLFSGALPGGLHAFPRGLMQNPLSIWLGKVSYSMYLVHWPLIVLYRYQNGLELTFFDQALLAAATLLATCILHYGIERRFYHRGEHSTNGQESHSGNVFLQRTALATGLLALIASSAWLGDGWAWRFPSLSLSANEITEGMKDRFTHSGKACRLDNPEGKKCNFHADIQLLVLGNSAETDGFNFIRAGYGDNPDLNLILFGETNQCKNLRESEGRFLTDDASCQTMLDNLFDPAMIARLDIVLYAANMPYASNKQHFLALLQKLKSANPDIQVVTFGGYIVTDRPCTYYINKFNTTDACAAPENVHYFEDDRRGSPLYGAISELESHYIDRVGLLCKNRVLETCLTRSKDGTPALYDRVHYSIEFSEMSGAMYAERHPTLIQDLLNRQKHQAPPDN